MILKDEHCGFELRVTNKDALEYKLITKSSWIEDSKMVSKCDVKKVLENLQKSKLNEIIKIDNFKFDVKNIGENKFKLLTK